MSATAGVQLLACAIVDLGELVLVLSPGARRLRDGLSIRDAAVAVACEMVEREDAPTQHPLDAKAALFDSPRLGLFVVEQLEARTAPTYMVLTPAEVPAYLGNGGSIYVAEHHAVDLDRWIATRSGTGALA